MGTIANSSLPASPTPVRDDLLGKAVLVTGLAQLAGLLIQDFGSDATGHALEVSPLNALMLQVPLYASGLFAMAAAWTLVRALLPRAHRVVDLLGVLVMAALVAVTEVDFGMQRFRGERVSLNQFTTYGTGDVLNSDWVAPLLASPVPSALMLATIALGWVGLAAVWWRGRGAPHAGVARRSVQAAALFGAGAVACYLPTRFAYYHQRQMARSPQAVLFEAARSKPQAWDAASEATARAALRAGADGAQRAGWLADSFPLWRAAGRGTSPAFGAAVADPPDIVIFSIESLRGRDTGWGFGDRQGAASLTPHLDSIARDGVTLPYHLAGGEPTPRGFITFQAGIWEHGQLFIVANHPELRVDALPLRVRAAGYRNLAFFGGNPSFDNELTWARRWYDEVVFGLLEKQLFYFRTTPDWMLMNRVIERIAAHDSTHAGQPLFAYVASNGTHTPYDLEDSAAVTADVPPSSDRQRRYDLVLRNADAQIGRVLASLRSRPRWRNTVIIVVGDHSDRTSELGDARWRGMPTDALVATSGFIYGPRRLIGEPRAITATTSHVDFLPTIMNWLGDTSAVATLGRDIFDTTRASAREAVAINSRGYRLDRGGYTLMVDSSDPKIFGAWKSFTGESPTLVPLSETPFAADDPARLHERIAYWTYLVDNNRVRPR